jgi:hypothetical protein
MLMIAIKESPGGGTGRNSAPHHADDAQDMEISMVYVATPSSISTVPP